MNNTTRRCRVALVGAGNIARIAHLPALAAHAEHVEVVGVADAEFERALALAREWGIPDAFASLTDMLDARRPDLVIVCTPPIAHRAAIIESLDAGAWVWCEKPPVLSLAEFDEIESHVAPEGPYVSYVFQHRFGAGAARLKRQITGGELGEPTVAVCNTLWYRDDEYFAVPWRGRWETEGGGPTLGHGIHQIDLALHLLGDWSEIRATMRTIRRSIETEDVSMASVVMESGAMMSVTNSLLSPREESYLRFDLTDATVELRHVYGYDNADWTWTPAPHVAPAVAAGWPPVEAGASSHTAQLGALLQAYRAGERPPVSGADARRSLEFITGLYKSAITGSIVHRSELTPGDPFYASLDGGRRRATEAVA